MFSTRNLLLASCLAVGGISASALSASAQTSISTQPGGLSLAVSTGNSGLELYRIGEDGVATLLQNDIFPDQTTATFNAGDTIVDSASGKVYFKEADRGSNLPIRYRIYNAISDEFEGYTTITGTSDDDNVSLINIPYGIKQVVNKECISSDGSTCPVDTDYITLGGEGSEAIATIDDEGLSVGGKSIVRREINTAGEEELHIGENSLVTVESDGVQKLYATDANGTKIPINITEGSDLQINGVSVKDQIDGNTNAIDSNRANINNLGDGIAASTALGAALSALPVAATDAPFSCGVGTGGYSSRFAMSLGCAAKLNQRLSLNAGGSHVFGGSSDYGGGSLDTVAWRGGFVFKLGKLDSPAATNEQLQSQLDDVKQENTAIKAKYSTIEEQNKDLMARLQRLEAIALGQ